MRIVINEMSCKKGHKYLTPIPNRGTGARMEATSNNVKSAVRIAYGFRNADDPISTSFLNCDNLPIVLPER